MTILGAVLAFIPILAVDYVLDGYVRVREISHSEQYVRQFSSQIEHGVGDALATMRRVLQETPSLCTPTFVTKVQAEIESSQSLRQVLVENADGVQYCDAFGRQVDYSPRSGVLSIPGYAENVSLVKLGGMDMPALKISQAASSSRIVSAFLPLLSQTNADLSAALPAGSMLRVVLSDGTPVMTVGDSTAFDRRTSTADFVSAQSYAGPLPLKVEYAMPFAMARANYVDLDAGLTLMSCVVSGALLLLSLTFVRRSRVPAFDLERAIARNEIKPYYQPVINLRTGALIGCEVLCRWEKKNGEVVPPGAFIDFAEVTGLAIPMTLSLMQQVRMDLNELSLMMPNMKIAINLFEGHFRDDSIVEDVQDIFGSSAINFNQLVFEITERHPLHNSAVANSVIAGLHALGARIAMDDAGTGHSNLAYLGTLGIDIIKIDRIFIDMIKPETTQVPVLDGLITMAKDMDCEIVAEGVETEAQALYLRSRGVVQAQGWLFAPALKVGAFRELATALHQTRFSNSGNLTAA
jgi:EAL domain-containing protein (putative c-di-GMP-specific phosphodiesterase class I)